MIEELLQDAGRIFLGRCPQHGLEPHGIDRLFVADLVPSHTQELCDFPADGRVDRLGFFLPAETFALATVSAV